jgi:hypothetical protein
LSVWTWSASEWQTPANGLLFKPRRRWRSDSRFLLAIRILWVTRSLHKVNALPEKNVEINLAI